MNTKNNFVAEFVRFEGCTHTPIITSGTVALLLGCTKDKVEKIGTKLICELDSKKLYGSISYYSEISTSQSSTVNGFTSQSYLLEQGYGKDFFLLLLTRFPESRPRQNLILNILIEFQHAELAMNKLSEKVKDDCFFNGIKN